MIITTEFRLFLFILVTTLSAVSCSKPCKKSDMDCSAIFYYCDKGNEVCGCDGKTYACALDAECKGRIADYSPGKCK